MPYGLATLEGCLTGDDDFAIGESPARHASLIEDLRIEPGQVLFVVASTFNADTTIESYSINILTEQAEELTCDDEGDEDGDGATDCADSDCVGTEACIEVCDDGQDNDLDEATDCQDSDCALSSDCLDIAAQPIAPAGDGLTITGAIDENDPLWSRPNETCFSFATGEFHYDLYAVINETGADQELEVSAIWDADLLNDPDYDGYIHVFGGDPIDLGSLDSCLGGNDDGETSADSFLTGPIADGEILFFVLSTFTAGDTIPAYTLNIDTLGVE
jgi:hypothetical protein